VEEGEDGEEEGEETYLKLVDCKASTPLLLLVRKYGLQSEIRGTQVDERRNRRGRGKGEEEEKRERREEEEEEEKEKEKEKEGDLPEEKERKRRRGRGGEGRRPTSNSWIVEPPLPRCSSLVNTAFNRRFVAAPKLRVGRGE
jgi:hypothetical protein